MKPRVLKTVNLLKTKYPEAICSLIYSDPFQLLIATRLSAQCTDARVNMVTPALFARFPDAESMAVASLSEVENLIKSCGLYKTKAKSIVECAGQIINDFGGNVPDNMDDLLKLKGIGRKTANLIMGDVYGKPAVVADTHFLRICGRLGFINTKDPYKAELIMKKLLPPSESSDFCHRLVLFGREICTARAPKCGECLLFEICPSQGI